jgi:hypothetical protein
MVGFNESPLRVIHGGKEAKKHLRDRKNTVTFCTHTDKNGRAAIFCEYKKYRVIYAFYSNVAKKYAVLTLSPNRIFKNMGAGEIAREWQKEIEKGAIEPAQYGRSLLANSYSEALATTMQVLEEMLFAPKVEMPYDEAHLCVSLFIDLFNDAIDECFADEKNS